MMRNTKLEILYYIKSITKVIDFRDMSKFSASSVSSFLSISRSLASQYLNELFKEGLLIKISSRPVLFIHKNILKYEYGLVSNQSEFISLHDLLHVLNDEQSEKKLKLIGENGSIKDIMIQACAAVSFPPYGQTLLLIGEKYIGKRKISKSLYNYLKRQNDCSSDFYTHIKANNLTFKEELISCIENNNQSFIYVSNTSDLNESNQLFLSEIINTRVIKYNQTKVNFYGNFTLSANVNSLISELSEQISYTLNIPSFTERYLEERKEFVILFFRDAAKNFKKDVIVSPSIIYKLANYEYERNLKELRNTILNIASLSNVNNDSQKIVISNYHLPNQIKHLSSDQISDNNISVFDYNHLDYKEIKATVEKMIGNSNKINSYLKIVEEYNYDINHLKIIENKMLSIINNDVNFSKLNYLKEEYKLICKLLYLEIVVPELFELLDIEFKGDIDIMINSIKKDQPILWILSKRLLALVSDYLNLTLSIVQQYVLLTHISLLNTEKLSLLCIGISEVYLSHSCLLLIDDHSFMIDNNELNVSDINKHHKSLMKLLLHNDVLITLKGESKLALTTHSGHMI